MAITLATGTVFAYASTYGASFNITAITNASEAVATLGVGHGTVVGDYLEVTSGWDRLNGRIVRAKTVATNDVTFELINTTSTTLYPAGTGTGTVRRITAWTNVSQVGVDFSVSGGDQQYADITTIADAIQKQIPTQRTPVSVVLPLFDDPTLAWVAGLRTVSETATATGFRASFPNGSKLVANAYYSLRDVPTVSDSTLRGEIAVAFAAAPVRYPT